MGDYYFGVSTYSLVTGNWEENFSYNYGAPLTIPKGRIFNTAEPGAAVNLFAADLTPTRRHSLFRITCCFSNAGRLSLRRTYGGVTVTEILNNNIDLPAGTEQLYEFDVTSDETFNFRYSGTQGTTYYFKVVEV